MEQKKKIPHLELVQQEYPEHFWFAQKWGLYLIWTGIASMIHGLIPALFPFTAPRNVLKIARMIHDRNVPGENDVG
jgi:hypothetical protein